MISLSPLLVRQQPRFSAALGTFMRRFLTLTQMSKIPVMWANHTNRMWEQFLCSLMLNVYAGVSVCGSSGRLRVLSSLYLWATTVVRTHTKHALMRKMFQSWVGLVLFFLVFTLFKIPEGKLSKSQPEFARLYLYCFDLEICIYFLFIRIVCGCSLNFQSGFQLLHLLLR